MSGGDNALRDFARQHGEEIFEHMAQMARTGPPAEARKAYRMLNGYGLPILAWAQDGEDLVAFLGKVARGERIARAVPSACRSERIVGGIPSAQQRMNALIWIQRFQEGRRLRAAAS